MTASGRIAEMAHLLCNLDAASGCPRERVERAVERLPARLRAIVTRCDLAGERHAAVASHLGISERHFYRERRKALLALATALETLPPQPIALRAADADPATAVLSCASAFANVGRHGEALAVLERAISEGLSGEACAELTIRMAELCCAAGDRDRAAEYVAVADRHVQSEIARLEASNVHAELLFRSGETERAKERLEQTIRSLRALSESTAARKARALVNAHFVLVEIADDEDAFGAGLEAALEAANASKRFALEPAVRMRAQLTLTQMRMLTATPMRELLDRVAADYDFARTHGLPKDSANTSGFFCVLYSYSGDHSRAVAFGRRSLEIDRTLGSDDRVHRYYLAWALLRMGKAYEARTTLQPVLVATNADAFDYVVPRLIVAEALHVERHHGAALAIARTAVNVMRKAGSERGLGSALRVQAEIQGALGETCSAKRSIDQALSLLEKNGPPFALAQAYHCSARLTGNRRHKRVAREMMELFHLGDGSKAG